MLKHLLWWPAPTWGAQWTTSGGKCWWYVGNCYHTFLEGVSSDNPTLRHLNVKDNQMKLGSLLVCQAYIILILLVLYLYILFPVVSFESFIDCNCVLFQVCSPFFRSRVPVFVFLIASVLFYSVWVFSISIFRKCLYYIIVCVVFFSAVFASFLPSYGASRYILKFSGFNVFRSKKGILLRFCSKATLIGTPDVNL